MPTAPKAPAISAPDLIGPTSILNWPTAAAGTGRKARARPFAHVHLEIDLAHEAFRETELPVLRQVEAWLREREVVETGDLLRLVAGLLSALSSQGFSRVGHWEADPGGWLPLPEESHAQVIEPVGHLLSALKAPQWKEVARARSFAVRLSGARGGRADAVVRRIHRERHHAVSLDLWGVFTREEVHEILSAVRVRIPVLRSKVTAYAYA